MIISPWPIPPINENDEIPQIPKEYKCFGMEFVVDDKGVPYEKGIERLEEFNPEEIKVLVNKSLKLFKKILNSLIQGKDGSKLIEDLRITHEKINRIINGCRHIEGRAELSRIIRREE
jgi:hypothetical protein